MALLCFRSSRAAASSFLLSPNSDVHKNKNLFCLFYSTHLFPFSNTSEKLNDCEAVKEVSTTNLLHVALLSPQIPGNTGAIARTCAAAGVGLHLIEPMAFQVDDTKLKRAGLYYWPYVFVKQHSSWGEFRNYFRQQSFYPFLRASGPKRIPDIVEFFYFGSEDGEKRLLAFTKSGTNIHSEFSYRRGDWLVFGSETTGLTPEALLDCSSESLGGGTIRIPMIETHVRCLNQSVSVGIALYEASRQLNYEQFPCPSEQCISGDDNTEQSLFTEDIFA